MSTMIYVLCMAMLAIVFWKLYAMGEEHQESVDPRLFNYNHLIDCVKIIESDLKRHLGARGRTLSDKLDSVQALLPEDLHERIRHIASIQTRVINEQGYEIADPGEFVSMVNSVLKEIRGLRRETPYGAIPLHLNGSTKA